MTRILHVTDLHVTPPHESLTQVWSGAAAYLREKPHFDFVVVSGDLSQAADAVEYEKLESFTNAELLPLLKTRERRRVIFVPGNHDVDRKKIVHKPMRLAALDAGDIATSMRKLRSQPASGKLRLSLPDTGHMELLRVDDDSYRSRFDSVQSFFDRFYGSPDGLPALDQRFRLASVAGDGDWSCHYFKTENVAFIGLSSCRFTDAYWHGASFEPESLNAARRHVEKLRKDAPHVLVVAVWHHGLTSEADRPDRLSLADMGEIFNIGARVGFHGHTHRDDLDEKRFLAGNLVVIATGSIGAGNAELPPGVDNQFAIVDLFPTLARVERVERNSHAAQFNPRPTAIVQMAPLKPMPPNARAAIGTHRRVWTVDSDGIAEVRVTMDEVTAQGRLSLACLNPPFCHAVHSRFASTEGGNVSVHDTPHPDGRLRFWLADSIQRAELKWSYKVSNAVALSSAELRLLPKRTEWFRNIQANEDIRSHTVRDDCRVFQLELRFEGSTRLVGARPLVERPISDLSDYPWERDEEETERAERTFGVDEFGRGAQLRIEAPRVGYRYSIVYAPSDAPQYPEEAARLSRVLLQKCRGEQPAGGGGLRAMLTAALDAEIRTALEIADSPAPWVAFLWEHDRRLLLPAFGEFQPATWGARFAAGNGVAGHCFRHNRGTVWSRREGSVLYQERTDHGGLYSAQYEHMVCIPLLIAYDGPSIGVVSFARGSVAASAFDERLREIADAGGDVGDNPSWKALLSRVMVGFWTVVAKSKAITPQQREFAERCADLLQQKAV